jgi:hypothetical protein
MPAFNHAVVELFEEVQGLNAVVGDADADVRQLDSCLDCLVESEALGGLQCTESLVHRFVHDFADEALVSSPLRLALDRHIPSDFNYCFLPDQLHVFHSVQGDDFSLRHVVVD